MAKVILPVSRSNVHFEVGEPVGPVGTVRAVEGLLPRVGDEVVLEVLFLVAPIEAPGADGAEETGGGGVVEAKIAIMSAAGERRGELPNSALKRENKPPLSLG